MLLKIKKNGALICGNVEIDRVVFVEDKSQFILFSKQQEEIINVTDKIKAESLFLTFCNALKNNENYLDLTGLLEE